MWGVFSEFCNTFQKTLRRDEEDCEKEKFSGSEIFHRVLSLSKMRYHSKVLAMYPKEPTLTETRKGDPRVNPCGADVRRTVGQFR